MLVAAGWLTDGTGQKGALTRVAKKLKVPHQTLARWGRDEQNPPPSELVHERKGTLVEALTAEIWAAVGAMPNARQDANYRDLVTGAAILTDKVQLLTGGATDNVNQQILIGYANTDNNPPASPSPNGHHKPVKPV